MKVSFLFILFSLSFSVLATDNCAQVVEGYEDNSNMYVVCSALPLMDLAEKNQQMETIMGQYEGEPDKITVYFVSSPSAVGKAYHALSNKELVGIYDAHDSLLTLWPKIASSKNEMFLDWETSL